MVDESYIRKTTLSYISRYNKTKEGVREYLFRKIPEAKDNQEISNLISKTLNDYENNGYIDDTRYATFKISSKIKAGKSVRFIKNYLIEKKVNSNAIESAFKSIANGANVDILDKIAIIRLCKAKKIASFAKNSDPKDFNKLMQRAFSYSSVEYVLNTNQEILNRDLIEFEKETLIL